MTNTHLDFPEVDRARHYEVMSNWARPAMKVDNSRTWAGGGIRSTAPDLTRYATRLADRALLSPASVDELLTEQLLADGQENPQHYGLGWRLIDTSQFLGGHKSYRLAHHGGVASGASAFLALFVEERLAVAVLSNARTGSGALSEVALDIAAEFMPLAEGAEARKLP
jgi:CubicO group peptidase (beta-lactamase class C family)